MTENGYTVSDMTDELRTDWRIGSLIEDSRSLHTEDMRIDFCVMDSTDSARRIYSGMTLPVKTEKNTPTRVRITAFFQSKTIIYIPPRFTAEIL